MATDRCDPGDHRWQLVRKYTGIERFDIHSVWNAENDETTGPSVLDPADNWGFNVTLAVDRDSDEYDGVQEEWLACARCPVEIRGERIGEIE